MKKKLLSMIIMLLVLSSCAGGSLVGISGPDNSNTNGGKDVSISGARIKSFTVDGIIGEIDANTITVVLPGGDTDTGALAPLIELTDPGATIYPASGQLQDFKDHAVLYTVISSDGVTSYYLATVSNSKNITSFSFPSISGAVGVISGLNIFVSVPPGTNKAGLTPTITASAGATISPSSGISQDFTYPVNYIVLAADNSVKIYTVTVRYYAKDITRFDILDASGTKKIIGNMATINGNNITASVQYGTTDLTHIITRFYTTTSLGSYASINGVTQDVFFGASAGWFPVSPDSYPNVLSTPVDFTHPAIYRITAEDTSTQDYTVTVTVRPSYIVGDIGPAGGLIFYVDPDNAKLLPVGKTYLELAKTNQDTTSVWSDIPDTLGTTGTAIGTGQANTEAIVAQSTNSAAALCYNPLNPVSRDGYSDWFLPSKDEIAAFVLLTRDMYHYRFTGAFGAEIITFLGDSVDYWSSSEYIYPDPDAPSNAVVFENMNNSLGATGNYDKSAPFHARCIRAF